MSVGGRENPHESLRATVERYAAGDRSIALTLLALVGVADDHGSSAFHDVMVRLRADYLASLRAEGRDADAEAGRLSLDEVREHLVRMVLPRLVSAGAIEELQGIPNLEEGRVRITPALWATVRQSRGELADVLRRTGEHPSARRLQGAPHVAGSSVLKATGLLKTYRRRDVVKDVALELHQGEIVGRKAHSHIAAALDRRRRARGLSPEIASSTAEFSASGPA